MHGGGDNEESTCGDNGTEGGGDKLGGGTEEDKESILLHNKGTAAEIRRGNAEDRGGFGTTWGLLSRNREGLGG